MSIPFAQLFLLRVSSSILTFLQNLFQHKSKSSHPKVRRTTQVYYIVYTMQKCKLEHFYLTLKWCVSKNCIVFLLKKFRKSKMKTRDLAPKSISTYYLLRSLSTLFTLVYMYICKSVRTYFYVFRHCGYVLNMYVSKFCGYIFSHSAD